MTEYPEQVKRDKKHLDGRKQARRDDHLTIKGLGRLRWPQDADRDAEVAAARNSAYYWWWMFLHESTEYRRALSGMVAGPVAKMAQDFGRLGNDFDDWWIYKGRTLFAEQKALPKVRQLEHGDIVDLDQINEKLVLELPLTIRRTTILKQINEQLDIAHAGGKLRVFEHGQGKRKLYAESRMRLATLELLYKVWMARKERPGETWYMTGNRLRISPVFIPRRTDSAKEIAYKNRCMTIVVRRYYRKASALIDFAAKGDFPRIK